MRYSLLMWLVCAAASAQNIFTVAGIPYSHRDTLDGKPALNAPLNNVHGLLIDKVTGRLLFSDQSLVSRLEPDGTLLAVVGRGLSQDGNTADGTLASFLSASSLPEMTQDGAGNLYVSDIAAGHVYRIALDGTVTTFAGGGNLAAGFASDGGPATAAQLISPRGLAFDSKGNLNIAEVFCTCIRRVSPAGIISTVYTLPSRPQPPNFFEIEGLTIDPKDNLYFAAWMGHVVVRVTPDGTATTIAGTGVAGFSGDGGPASAAQLNGPSAVTQGPDGSIYIADSGNNRVRKIGPDGTISTIAGTGPIIANLNLPNPDCAFSGDGGAAASARLCEPAELLFDNAGNLYITDYGNRRVRAISPGGIIGTVAGNGQTDPYSLPQGSSGDGGPAIHATFNLVGEAVFDPSGNLYVSEGNRIRKIALDGTISTFAGTGQSGYSGEGGPASQAMIANPGPLAVDAHGSLYVISGDKRIRKIAPDGTIHLVAGTGTGTGTDRAQGDGGLAVNATLNEPGAVAIDAQGNIYIADTSNARLRKIDINGVITTIAGPGQPGVDYFNAVALDSQGNIFLAWTHALLYPRVSTNAIVGTVNRVNPGGSLTPVAGNGQSCTGGPFEMEFPFDGMPALQAVLCEVPSMMIDGNGIMYLAYGSQVLRITKDGIIHTVAGNANATLTGDGGPALQASLTSGQGGPGTPTFDSAGNMYFPQTGLNRILEVTTTPYVLTLSPDHIGWVGPTAQTWSIATLANFAEPRPYIVHVHTADGGSWLSVNRVTGLTGESIAVSLNPAGLANGSYQGTISVVVGGIVGGGIAQQVDLPVSLSLPLPGIQ
jgi:sugar lactone lactonase YvrE